MSLNFKSEENIKLAERCCAEKQYTSAAVNRAYYSVYQKIKYLLVKHSFDYKSFRAKYYSKNYKAMDYSHRTIEAALLEFSANQKGKKLPSLHSISNLRAWREKADYEDEKIPNNTLKKLIEQASVVLKDLETLDE